LNVLALAHYKPPTALELRTLVGRGVETILANDGGGDGNLMTKQNARRRLQGADYSSE